MQLLVSFPPETTQSIKTSHRVGKDFKMNIPGKYFVSRIYKKYSPVNNKR